MSVLTYLQAKASSAVLTEAEKASISTSVATLETRLNAYFINYGDKLSNKFRFGSSTRGTILPRSLDTNSDIDYMTVFEKDGFSPQTYLDRLKRFVESKYSISEIYQSSQTIVLELNHIKFEIVPALYQWGSIYKIPKTATTWQDTNPNDFNSVLEKCNKSNSYLIKPTVRLAKLWNAANGYVFDSYLFEKWITNLSFWSSTNQSDYLFAVFQTLTANQPAQWRNDKINRAKEIIKKVREYEIADTPASAEAEVKKLIP